MIIIITFFQSSSCPSPVVSSIKSCCLHKAGVSKMNLYSHRLGSVEATNAFLRPHLMTTLVDLCGPFQHWTPCSYNCVSYSSSSHFSHFPNLVSLPPAKSKLVNLVRILINQLLVLSIN